MPFIGITSLNTALSRIFTRTYDVKDLTGLVDFLQANMTPAGSVLFIAAAVTLPDGWLYAEGGSISKTTYPDLFTAINYSYGGSGDNFTLPDLRDKIPMGAGVTAVAASGGANTINLATSQLPPHDHGIEDAGHTHAISHSLEVQIPVGTTDATGLFDQASPQTGTIDIGVDGTITAASATTGITIRPAGDGAGIDIRPAHIGMRPIIKA